MLSWRAHPLLKPLTDEEIVALPPQDVIEYHKKYHEAISLAERDPYRYGFVLPHWKHADDILHKFQTLYLSGSNRSGKTSYSARAVVKAAMENPESLIYAFSQNNDISVQVQQSAVYNYLPAEYKQKRLGDVEYISYSIATGFSNNKLIFPNKSQIVFKTYSQYQQDNSILEGMELGSREPKWANIGAWCDEYLRGMEMLDRLYLRLATRNARLLVTFTPKDGITETVRYYMDGAIDVEKRKTDVLQDLHDTEERDVPYVQHNARKNTGIVYFHSKDNPWSGFETLKIQCRSRADVNYTLTALYGVPAAQSFGSFPKFGMQNIIKPEHVPHKELTRYMCIDPGSNKNWAMVWVGVDSTGTWYVYDEWPGRNMGMWAEEKNGKYVMGEACRPQNFGYEHYKKVMQLKEQSGRDVFERYIDPRLGTAKYTSYNRQSDIRQELDEIGVYCIAAPGLHEADGLQKLYDLMDYDQSRPIDAMNRPRFYVTDTCKQMIDSLRIYNPNDPGTEAWKDFSDCLRYLATAGIMHIDPKKMKPISRFQNGY